MISKYAPLESHLRDSGREHVPMTFEEIARVIGVPLPESALKHRALWSNNPANWVMTKAWLAAGYETSKVDMANRRLVFRKTSATRPPSDTGGHRTRPGGDQPTHRPGSFARVFGALKGTIKILPGTRLTDPIGEDWDAAR